MSIVRERERRGQEKRENIGERGRKRDRRGSLSA